MLKRRFKTFANLITDLKFFYIYTCRMKIWRLGQFILNF